MSDLACHTKEEIHSHYLFELHNCNKLKKKIEGLGGEIKALKTKLELYETIKKRDEFRSFEIEYEKCGAHPGIILKAIRENNAPVKELYISYDRTVTIVPKDGYHLEYSATPYRLKVRWRKR